MEALPAMSLTIMTAIIVIDTRTMTRRIILVLRTRATILLF